MKKMIKSQIALCIVMTFAFLLCFPAMTARAVVPYQPFFYKKNVKIYYHKEKDCNYYLMQIKGKIKSAKSTKSSVVKIIEKANNDHIGLQVKKTGKTTLTVKTTKKTYKVKITVKKFKSAFSSFKVGKKKLKKFDPQAGIGWYSAGCKVTDKKATISIKLKSGWKLKSIKHHYIDAKGKNVTKKIKNNSMIDVSPLFIESSSDEDDFSINEVYVKIYNKKLKESRNVTVYFYKE